MKLHTWLAHFSARKQCSALLPWDDAYLLSAAEKARIAASIQQFQLGEGSDGSGLLRRAQSSPLAQLDAGFLPALELFIAEEQRHSRHLEAFIWRMFMLATLQVVWRHHAKVLRAGGRGYRAFINHCFELLDEVANCRYLPAAPIENTSPRELTARIAAERESEVLIPK